MFQPLSLDDPFTRFLFVAAIVMMLGYVVGRRVNTKRAQNISNWLETGLRTLGGNPTAQRVSRSAFRFIVTRAGKSFSTVTASVVLISREVLPTWLWEAIQRHQDVLILHVTFRQPPDMEAEIIDPASELGRRGESQAQGLNWPTYDLPGGLRVYSPSNITFSRVKEMVQEIARRPFVPYRVAVRQSAPHMLISMPVPDLRDTQSKDLMQLLTRLSKLCHSN